MLMTLAVLAAGVSCVFLFALPWLSARLPQGFWGQAAVYRMAFALAVPVLVVLMILLFGSVFRGLLWFEDFWYLKQGRLERLLNAGPPIPHEPHEDKYNLSVDLTVDEECKSLVYPEVTTRDDASPLRC